MAVCAMCACMHGGLVCHPVSGLEHFCASRPLTAACLPACLHYSCLPALLMPACLTHACLHYSCLPACLTHACLPACLTHACLGFFLELTQLAPCPCALNPCSALAPPPQHSAHSHCMPSPPLPLALPQVIRWFWEVVHALSEEQKKRLLFFVTGSDRCVCCVCRGGHVCMCVGGGHMWVCV